MREELKYRKAINFDLDTKALKKYYPNESNPSKNYHRAYKDIKKFMLDNGFEHRQRSGYRSKETMKSSDLLVFNKDLYAAFPWLRKCANQIDVTNIGKEYSLIEMDKQQQEALKTSEPTESLKTLTELSEQDEVEFVIERQIGGTFTVKADGITKEYSLAGREKTIAALMKDFGVERDGAETLLSEAQGQSTVDNELAKLPEQAVQSENITQSTGLNNETGTYNQKH